MRVVRREDIRAIQIDRRQLTAGQLTVESTVRGRMVVDSADGFATLREWEVAWLVERLQAWRG